MPSLVACFAILLLVASVVRAEELGLVRIRLEPGHRDGMSIERCVKETFLKQTVSLFKYSGTLVQNGHALPAEVNSSQFELIVTVKEADNNVLVRRHSKPTDKLFLTAASSGDHYICFQAQHPALSHHHSHGGSNAAVHRGVNPLHFPLGPYVDLALEIYTGQPGDSQITAPVTLQLAKLSSLVNKANDLVSDIRSEQGLQRVPALDHLPPFIICCLCLCRKGRNTFNASASTSISTRSSGVFCRCLSWWRRWPAKCTTCRASLRLARLSNIMWLISGNLKLIRKGKIKNIFFK